MTYSEKDLPPENLKHPDPEMRLQAIDHLLCFKDHRYLKSLMEVMGDKEWRVRKSAVNAIVGLEHNESLVVALINVLGEGANVGQRNSSEEALIKIGKIAVPALLKHLHSANSDVKNMIVEILGEIKDFRATAELIRMGGDSDDNVKLAAVESLGKLKDPNSIEFLIKNLESDNILLLFVTVKALKALAHPQTVDPLLRISDKKGIERVVIEALGVFSDTRVQGPILKALEKGGSKLRVSALCALYHHYQHVVFSERDLIRERTTYIINKEFVSCLKKLLESSQEKFWAPSLLILGWSKDSESVSTIIPLLDGSLKEEAVTALICLGEEIVHTLSKIVVLQKDAVREGIAHVLGEIGNEASLNILRGLLSDANGHVRQRAAIGLGNTKDFNTTKGLLNLLSDPYRNVQETAVKALGKVEGPEGLKEIVKILKNKDPRQRVNAMSVLGNLKEPVVLENIILGLKDENPEVRKAAVDALGLLGGKDISTPLLQAMGDEDKNVRLAALNSVLKSPHLDIIKIIKPMLQDENIWIRTAVARGLGDLNSSVSKELLVGLLSDKVGVVQIKALEGLGKSKDRSLCPIILKLTEGKDPNVIRVAIETLGELGSKVAVKSIKKFVTHSNWIIRSAAVRALGKLMVTEAIGEIEQLSKEDPNRMVRVSAEDSLIILKRGL